MHNNESVFKTFEKAEVNCNLHFNDENAGIRSVDENETVIREIEAKLFIKDGIRPQVKHSI